VKIAWFSPLPPKKSGIADFSRNVLTYLKKFSKLILFVEDYWPTESLARDCLVFQYVEKSRINWRLLEQVEACDLVFFNMSNDFRFHSYAYELLLRYPGIVILHDYVLQFFYAGYYLIEKRNFSGYVEKFKELYALDLITTYPVADGRTVILNFLKKIYVDHSILWYPMNEEIISKASALVVHSDFALQNIKKKFLSKLVVKIDLPYTLPEETLVSLQSNPYSFSVPKDRPKLIAATFGYVLPNKAYELVFKVLQSNSMLQKHMEYWIVGGTFFWYNIHSLAKKYKLQAIVKIFGYQEPEKVQEILSCVDLCIALRDPTMGETSSSLLNQMLLSKPVVVLNVGWYAELPNTFVFKLNPESAEKELEEILKMSLFNRSELIKMGNRAREYVLAHHTPMHYAQKLMEVGRQFNEMINKKID
jgi:glycosyltransferase involved in cell wall biosynthesis